LLTPPFPTRAKGGKAKRKRAKAPETQKASSALKSPATPPDEPLTKRKKKSPQGDNVLPSVAGPSASDSKKGRLFAAQADAVADIPK
jgi:hypothetical protein